MLKETQAGGRTFAIPSLAEYQVLISSKDQVKELSESSEDVLSFHAAMNDVRDACVKYYIFIYLLTGSF